MCAVDVEVLLVAITLVSVFVCSAYRANPEGCLCFRFSIQVVCVSIPSIRTKCVAVTRIGIFQLSLRRHWVHKAQVGTCLLTPSTWLILLS